MEAHVMVEVAKIYLDARLNEIEKLKEEVARLKNEIRQFKMAHDITIDEPL
jgi:hypothetical protein